MPRCGSETTSVKDFLKILQMPLHNFESRKGTDIEKKLGECRDFAKH